MNLDPPSICLPCLYLAEVVAVASCHSTGHSAVCVAGTHQTACLADLAALRSGSGDKEITPPPCRPQTALYFNTYALQKLWSTSRCHYNLTDHAALRLTATIGDLGLI